MVKKPLDAVVDPPSERSSITLPAETVLFAVGVALKELPAAEPLYARVTVPLVIPVTPIKEVTTESATVIAVSIVQ